MYQMFVQVINLPDGKQPDQLSSEEIRAVLRVQNSGLGDGRGLLF